MCRELELENGGQPKCAACDRPRGLSRKNAQAWEAWCTLDRYGREIDGMGGYPLSLRLADMATECARYDDPDGIRWRVQLLEEKALEWRRAAYSRKQSQRSQRKKR